ncbi:MAG: translation initiation factor eIF-6, partial [Thermoplasmata archaeon]|nr:translation initiation factor eIF-6 [Thermoplasmata archaeon]
MLKKYHVEGNSFIGIVATANESIAILPTIPAIDSLIPLVKETLGVEKVIQTSVDGSYLVGAFVSMNSNG